MFDDDVFKTKPESDQLLIDKKRNKHDGNESGVNDDDDSNDDDRRDSLRDRWTSDFTDTDFSKESFRDFRDDPKEAVFDDAAGDVSSVSLDSEHGADGRKDVHHDDKRGDITSDFLIGAASEGAFSGDDDDWMRLSNFRKKIRKDDDKRRLHSLEKLVPGMLQDWVPSKVDRLQNGGFATAADNGFPVPYTLNGWVEIERDFPWGGQP